MNECLVISDKNIYQIDFQRLHLHTFKVNMQCIIPMVSLHGCAYMIQRYYNAKQQVSITILEM